MVFPSTINYRQMTAFLFSNAKLLLSSWRIFGGGVILQRQLHLQTRALTTCQKKCFEQAIIISNGFKDKYMFKSELINEHLIISSIISADRHGPNLTVAKSKLFLITSV